MHRYETRHVSGALTLVIALVVSLVVGALGVSAQAEETPPSPSGEPTGSAEPQPSEPTPTDDPAATDPAPTNPAATESPSGQPPRLLAELDGPTANPDTLVVRRGVTTSMNVMTNDVCNGAACTIAIDFVPSGWSARASTTTPGVITVTVPAKATPRRYSVTYTLSNGTPETSHTTVAVLVTPDSYSAPAGMRFSHPFRPSFRFRIRTHILRTINSVPPGGQIKIASWSFSSSAYYRALWYAKRRGVSVQIVLSARNTASISDYPTLRRLFGTRVTSTGSWVKRCSYSCRGRSGTMHSKIFLFSQAYRTPWVSMTGSANLTNFAVESQWNQMNTVSNNKPVYNSALRIFTEMVRDRVASPMYVENHFPGLVAYFYPRGAPSISTDFMMKALAPVRCKGAVNAGRNGRTVIKIAVYAWYQERGKWLAKRVRQLWEQGCQVQIVYGISSNPVKKILYSPAGRGRIPMRQILLTNTAGNPIYYMHNKWVAINGYYAGARSNSVALQGSFNFSDLGFRSDENFQLIRGRATYDRFARDFELLWKAPQARAPSPVSTITNVERTAPSSPTLGTGTYRYMEAD